MRLLFITNFFPPISRGGYELWCQEVAEGLRSKGHEIIVLTSNFQKASLQDPSLDWVRRDLNLEMEFREYSNVLRFFFQRRKKNAENHQILENLLIKINPQAVCVWGMWNLNRSLLSIVENRLPGRVAYYMGDYWPFLPSQLEMYWNSPAKNPLTFLPKKVLGKFAQKELRQEVDYQVQFKHILFPSQYMQNEFAKRGLCPDHASVIYGGVCTRDYAGIKKIIAQGEPFTLLFAGRLTEDKGVHTAIEAASILIDQYHFSDFKLKIVGAGEPEYTQSLLNMVQAKKLDAVVSLHDPYPKEKMGELYANADIFLFTSIWQEPFGRVLVEAMASGVVVIGTATGGSGEILLDGKTGLTYPPGDSEALAERIFSLYSDRKMYDLLSSEGRKFAIEKFSIERMVNEIEDYFLTHILGEPRS